jgi:hypothetical protein
MRPLLLFALPLWLACAAQLPDHVELQPQAENVEFAYEPPSPDSYKEVGRVTAFGSDTDPDAALESAKNDLRNKAAAMGAVLVTIDENVGVPVPLSSKTKVKLVGRAYQTIETPSRGVPE